MVGRNLVETAPEEIALLIPSREELNLLDYDATLNYLQTNQPDLIIHAAGIVGGIQANLKDPVRFLLENTDMGRNIVWAAHNSGIKNLFNLGSSCMYPRFSNGLLKENQILGGELEPTNEGYALAKIFTQRLCAYITKQLDGFAYKTIIPCNLYGRFDKFDPEHSHMIPAVIHKIHQAKTQNASSVEIWGDGTAKREFMYAGDLAEMIWNMVMRFEELPELMNVGLGHDYTINEYYTAVADVVGFNGEFVHDLSKPVGMKQKLVDVTLQNSLGLSPKHSLKEGIELTYQYYLQTNKEL